MVDSAKKIVKFFAGSPSNNNDLEQQDICHVGSALFLGPRLRLMCAKKVKKVTQHAWSFEESESVRVWGQRPRLGVVKVFGVPLPIWGSATYSDPYKYYNCDNMGVYSSCPYSSFVPNSAHTGWVQGPVKQGAYDWLSVSPDNLNWKAVFEERDGLKTKGGLLFKFREFQNDEWMNYTPPSSNRAKLMMTARGDVSGVGG